MFLLHLSRLHLQLFQNQITFVGSTVKRSFFKIDVQIYIQFRHGSRDSIQGKGEEEVQCLIESFIYCELWQILLGYCTELNHTSFSSICHSDMLGGWVYMVNIVNTGIGYGCINLLAKYRYV